VVKLPDALEVDADDRAGFPDFLGGDLEPTPRGGPKINDGVAVAQEICLPIKLFELVGRSRAVALLFGAVVVFVFAAHRFHLGVGFSRAYVTGLASVSISEPRYADAKTCRTVGGDILCP